ncbi:MAG: GDP-mannose 4,6-dehydratase [Verrucomicrobiota bacterium]|jgi:UDP-glucose 4-epimerase|nr:GDP-mannose 4,6-dehydratase [Verrucomicrobiota bacterium]MDP7177413.1 GDP-mannose 4,6-dehydratase [Verrucomicrobiota bacterium]MDP7292911.1 GDP-mannose 4,6-dehydratase [Verrucomicrobiota bacterium]MDP7440705.1 GDP-mannose 4,6-dehydratase [Verrucomicrobiota bacterium]|tara:strand:+ start:269 stop:1249 length:981 start_codon:yes stop_codon:yes gene_type:complete
MTPSGVPDAPHTLITGGAGFIGSHLAERLLGQGERVVVIDDFSTGSQANLAAVADNPNLTLIESDVIGCESLGQLVAESGYVFHLAAAVGVDLVVQSPIRTIETNLKATEAILEAATPGRTPMLLPSSSEVYGKSSREGFAETDDLLIGPPTLGRWSYACSKLMDEFLALAFHAERQLPVTVARIFNTVGPRQTGRYGMVLPRFVEVAKVGEPLRVFGDGRQSRCFCHVNDTVEALLRLAKCDRAAGGVFNIGSTEETTILNLAKRVIDLTESRSEIELVPYDEAYDAGFEDMKRRKPVIDKLEAFTGFRPATGLDDIILNTAGLN